MGDTREQVDERPLLISFLGWALILPLPDKVLRLFSFFTGVDLGLRRISSMNEALFYAASGAYFGMCGYGVLKGFPWSRLLYVATTSGALTLFVFASKLSSALSIAVFFGGLILLTLCAWLLFSPAADRWFAAKGLQLRRSRARIV